MKMKNVPQRHGMPEAKGGNRREPGLEGPITDGTYGSMDSLKLFEYARSMLRARGLAQAEALSDVDPPLMAELRRRDLTALLTHSLQMQPFDDTEVERHVADVLRRQSLKATPEEISRLVSLIPELYTVPDFQHVKDKAAEAGVPLTDEEITKMCWAIRGFIQYMNQRP